MLPTFLLLCHLPEDFRHLPIFRYVLQRTSQLNRTHISNTVYMELCTCKVLQCRWLAMAKVSTQHYYTACIRWAIHAIRTLAAHWHWLRWHLQTTPLSPLTPPPPLPLPPPCPHLECAAKPCYLSHSHALDHVFPHWDLELPAYQ